MQLIDGKATAAAIKAEIAEEVKEIVAKGGKQPHLAAVLVGHDGGSETYVKNKVLACEACGFKSTLIRFEEDVTEAELLACVDNLNRNGDVDVLGQGQLNDETIDIAIAIQVIYTSQKLSLSDILLKANER